MTISSPYYGIALCNGEPADPLDFPRSGSSREAYEVLRVIEGRPLFFREHLARLDRTLRLIHAEVHPLAPEIYIGAMERLDRLNSIRNGNIRMSLFIAEDGSVREWWMGFTPHQYPTEAEYLGGVAVRSMMAQRTEPNAKLVQAELRRRSEEIISREHVYETILLGTDGEITEGSRSNVFFIRGGKICTAPDHKVLEGVTRAVVIRAIQMLGLPFELRSIFLPEVNGCNAAFLTGTSRGVLPIRLFDAVGLNPTHEWISMLQAEYERAKR